ncbi:MAG: hypothetical protein AAFV19_08700 [Pseudomonadota bacterium]
MSAQTRALARKLKKQNKNKSNNVSEDKLSDLMQAEMANARLGILYIFSKAEADGKFASLFLGGIADATGNMTGAVGSITELKSVSTTATVISAAKVPLEQGVKKLESNANKGTKSQIQIDDSNSDKVKSSLDKLVEGKFLTFVKSTWAKLTAFLGDKVTDMGNWGKLIKMVIKSIVSAVVEAAVPLSGIFDVVKGTAQALSAGFQRVMSWIETSNAAMIKGHPTLIIGAIQKAMNRSIGEGLYTAIKGGVQIGGDIATAGGGALVKALAAGIETLAQVILRIFELTTFETFCNEAKQHWDARETSGFTRDPKAFATWFKKYVNAVPAIGALAMNCGYCGGPAQYLAMFKDDNSLISQKDFDAGISMLHRHKKFAADYLNDIGLAFKSHDPVVNCALKAAKNFNQKNHISQNGVGDVIYGVLTG